MCNKNTSLIENNKNISKSILKASANQLPYKTYTTNRKMKILTQSPTQLSPTY